MHAGGSISEQIDGFMMDVILVTDYEKLGFGG